MANDMKYLSAEEEAKLLKPIDEYIGKIQKQIDALRKDGSDKVQELKTHISLVRENKNYTNCRVNFTFFAEAFFQKSRKEKKP